MKINRRITIASLIACFCVLSLAFNGIFCSLALAAITKLSPNLRTTLEKTSSYRLVPLVKNLPVPLIQLFANDKGGLADPGQQWRADCTVLGNEEGLPARRLIWAVACGDLYVIHYEAGGRTHSYHVILGTFNDKNEAKVLWHGVGAHFKSFEVFLSVVKNHNSDLLDDRLDYYP